MPSDAHEVDADQFAERMVAELHGRRTEDGILRDPADAVEHARSRGVQVDLPFKSEMESHFGVSFDYVKAFTGRASEEACKFVSAAAFAVHDLIVLADPSPKREQLLHELTHIMQMGKQPAPPRFAPGSILVGERESEAEHEAAAPVHGARPRVSAPANVIHREDPAKPTLLPDSSTPEERIKIFANDAGKWAPEKHAGNADTWPYGAKLSDGTWLMYERSSPESFQLREYQKRLWEHPANDFNKKYLSIFSPDVLGKIGSGSNEWESMVPSEVAQAIKSRRLFGYR